MKTRLSTWITIVAALFALQLGWWGVLIWNQSRAVHDAQYRILTERRRLAEGAWERRTQELGDSAAAWQEIQARYPGIVLVPGPEFEDLQIDAGELEALQAELRARHLMVFGEGGLFLVITGLLLGWFLRSTRRERFLSLQHSNFLHAVTHEFRSPIHSLRLALDSMLRRMQPGRERGYAEGMQEDLARLQTLVENVLTVGRLDADAFDAHVESIDLSQAVRAQSTAFLARNESMRPLTTIEVQPELHAEADGSTLEAIVRNLLDNAMKYGQGKPIHLSLVREQDSAVFRVRDQGCGLAANELPHVFDRFWRAGDERVRTAQGVGLGLFLVKELVRAQAAQISARSEGPEHGCEFSVRWPLSRVGDTE